MTLTAGGITIIVFAVILILLITGLFVYKAVSSKKSPLEEDETLAITP